MSGIWSLHKISNANETGLHKDKIILSMATLILFLAPGTPSEKSLSIQVGVSPEYCQM